MIVTFGLLTIFFAIVVAILQVSYVKDRSFTDYAIGGRAFGARYQAMSFLNTWYPGAMFTAFAGLAARSGVISFYVLAYSLLTVVLMYVMAQTVWVWGQRFDLRTQPDLLALRYGSRHIRPIAALIGIVSGLPWLVLSMQAMGGLFHYMSLGALPFSSAVLVSVAVIVVRQFWTVRMGMRGVIISDFFQGIVAYVGGAAMLIGLIAWLVLAKGCTLSTLDPKMFELPSFGSKEGPLYLFSLLLTGAVGGWCWPFVFVRLFTADGFASIKKSAAFAVPLSLLFCGALLLFGMLASRLPSVAARPEDVWFLASREAGGVVLLGLAGVVLLAASMGHTDGSIQATGAQIANDLVGTYRQLEHRQLILVSKVGMAALTALAAWLACLQLPALFSLAVLAYQGVIQLAVPQFLGIFWRRGNAVGAIGGMIIGFSTAVSLEVLVPNLLAHAQGLSSGVVGLAVNHIVYVAAAYLLPQSREESLRVAGLFRIAAGRDDTANEVRAPGPQAVTEHV